MIPMYELRDVVITLHHLTFYILLISYDFDMSCLCNEWWKGRIIHRRLGTKMLAHCQNFHETSLTMSTIFCKETAIKEHLYWTIWEKNHKSDSLQGHSGLLWCDLHDSATWPDDKGSQWTWKWWMLDTKAGRECCLWVLAKRQLCRKKHVTRPDITRHLSADFFWYVSGVDTQLADLHSDTCAIHEIYWFQALLPVPGGRHPEEGQWFCDVGCCHSLHACFF